MYNNDVRAAIRKAGFKGYEVAAALGMNECSFSHRLSRSELPPDQKSRIFAAINDLYQTRLNELLVNPIGGESEQCC